MSETILPTEKELAESMAVTINVLKAGALITHRDDPRDGEKAAFIEIEAPVCNGYQFRKYPLSDFMLLCDLGFLELDSVNYDFGEWHYYWNFGCHPGYVG